MRNNRSIFILLLLTVFLPACRKGELVTRPAFITFSLDVFITDTAVFNIVSLDGINLSTQAQIINGTYANIVNTNQGIKKPDTNRVRLNVNVVKKNPPNLLYNKIITITNVNDFLLLQIDPGKAPVLINKITEAGKYIQPGQDSIKARFFFNDADKILNPNNNFSPVTVVDLQLYKESVRPNGTFYAEKDVLINGIKINALSDYFSFKENTFYGFDLLDGDPALPDNKRLIQKSEFVPYDHFITGRIDLNGSGSGKFQTIRLQKENGSSDLFIGQYLFAFK